MRNTSEVRFHRSMVVLANYAQFDARQRVNNPYVASRMLLWSIAGAGQVTINKKKYIVQPGDYFFLPWHQFEDPEGRLHTWHIEFSRVLPGRQKGHIHSCSVTLSSFY